MVENLEPGPGVGTVPKAASEDSGGHMFTCVLRTGFSVEHRAYPAISLTFIRTFSHGPLSPGDLAWLKMSSGSGQGSTSIHRAFLGFQSTSPGVELGGKPSFVSK